MLMDSLRFPKTMKAFKGCSEGEYSTGDTVFLKHSPLLWKIQMTGA